MSKPFVQWGITALSHDAAITVVHNKQDIVFAGHSERYSRIKNDMLIHKDLVDEALKYGMPDEIIWYEKPWKKKLRQLKAGQWSDAFDVTALPAWYIRNSIPALKSVPIRYVDHHLSHAAAGHFTCPHKDTVVLVVDSIGEFDTMTTWVGHGNQLKRTSTTVYPDSIGLFYSAMTEYVGLKPNEEEYIMMGMSAYGNASSLLTLMIKDAVGKYNFHCGVPVEFAEALQNSGFSNEDIAAGVQKVTEQLLIAAVDKAIEDSLYTDGFIDTLVLMGGCALNCVANQKISDHIRDVWNMNNLWIMPNPGDAGSSLGAIAAYNMSPLNWVTPFLGTEIIGFFRPSIVAHALVSDGIVGVAHGRAEFGPRALGNRSLLADPRGADIKDRVNDIKQRQRFRPFAPVILEEYADQYFHMPVRKSPYMQFTAKCKHPDQFPAICHVDNTSRVQTVTEQENPQMYAILKEWHDLTGCPMLLNTSLNIKGEPLVNTWEDAQNFSSRYNVRVF